MSIYRRKSSNGKRSRFYTAEFSYRGRVHRKAGLPDRDSARFWINTETLRLRRGEVGYVKAMLASQFVPLIAEFGDHLRNRNRDDMYAYISEKRLHRLAGDCGWITLAQFTADSLRAWLNIAQEAHAGRNRSKPISHRTKNQYIATATEFGAWLVKPRKLLVTNPMVDVERLSAKHNDEYRRAGTIEELNKLLATCAANRRLYYLFRIYTPMRGDTVGRLTWRMLHLDAEHPYAATPAEINKERKDRKHAIRFEVAQELRRLKKSSKAKVDDLVFPDAPTLDQYKQDLIAAGVEFDRGGNHRLDFHAFRTTLVQIGKRQGLTAFQIMDLMGWKSMATMMKHYNKASISADVAETMGKLPSIGTTRRAL